MLLQRYSNIDFVLLLDLDTGLKLIEKAIEKTKEERFFQQWVVQLPMMGMADSYISFEEYKDKITGKNIDFRPVNEIEIELDEIEKRLKKGGKDNGDGNI